MIVGIHQPNFLPWLGYFQKIFSCNVFILLDTVQLPRGKSFCNRTAIKAKEQTVWLTVPVLDKGKLSLINEVRIAKNQPWIRKHLGRISSFYGKAPFFNKYYRDLEQIYHCGHDFLVELNKAFLDYVAEQLGVKTELVFASTLLPQNTGGLDYLISLIKEVGGTSYLSGTGAGSRRYIREEQFANEGINLIWQNYVHPVYPQLGEGFISNLSVLDLLFNLGSSAAREIIFKGR